MGIDIRLPNITGQTEKEKLAQLQSYLYQLREQLQVAFDGISAGTSMSPGYAGYVQQHIITNTTGAPAIDAEATFSAIKSLIIKSADIVESYYEEINRKLVGAYVAQSDFGDFAEKTEQRIEETSTSTTQTFENIQVIIQNLGNELSYAQNSIVNMEKSVESFDGSVADVQESVTGINILLEDAKTQLQGSIDDLEVYILGLQQAIIGVTAYVKSGLLYYTDAGVPVYGLEIGQTVRDELTGEEAFNKYARFTSEKLSFYDSNGSEVAYISDKKLYIRFAEITVALKIGGFMDLVMDNGDVVTKWVGG